MAQWAWPGLSRPLRGLCLIAVTIIALYVEWPIAADAQSAKITFPSPEWTTAKPEALGYSSEKLELLRAWLKTQPTTALQVSVYGRVIFEYGDLKHETKVASMRKSVLAMLYGSYVALGQIDLGTTVEQAGLDDVQPFLPIEKKATLRQIMTARSGVYLDTANVEMNVVNPKRGSKQPGAYYQYQNWDFNAAGAAFEHLTGKSIFDALQTDIANPIGMQDFDRSLFRDNPQIIDGRLVSKLPEYAMYFSTRDLSRLGLLMLADGNWNGVQVMPNGWRDRLTTLVTPAVDIHPIMGGSQGAQDGRWGYGMLWWVWDAPDWPDVNTGPYQGAYTAMGANGQYVTVLPSLGMVIAHNVAFDFVRDGKTIDATRGVPWRDYLTILQILVSSRTDG